MNTKFRISTVLVLVLALSACAPKTATRPTTSAGSKATAIPQTAGPTPTARPQATPTVKPQPTPTHKPASTPTQATSKINDIVVRDQKIASDTILVSFVDAMQPGWVVVHADKNGQPGEILGYAAVPNGTSEDVKVTLDVAKATSKMIVMLHIDAGEIGKFEFPGPDVPATNGSETVMAVFSRLTG